MVEQELNLETVFILVEMMRLFNRNQNNPTVSSGQIYSDVGVTVFSETVVHFLW